MNVYFNITHDHLGYYVATFNTPKIPPNTALSYNHQGYRNYGNNLATKVRFINCDILEIPRGLKNTFQCFKTLEFDNTTLKTLTKHDLAEFKNNLAEIKFKNNKIEYLSDDLFEDFTNLTTISFEEVNLNFIEPNILDGLNNLQHVNFGINYRINPGTDLTDPNQVKQLLHDKIATKTVEELMNYPLGDRMLRYCYKIMSDNFTKQMEDMKVEHEKEKAASIKQIEDLKVEHEKEKATINKGLYADLNTFINNETTKDFKIQIEDHEFPVHKFLLAARSPTLAEILKNNPEVENLNLVDISVDIFEIILKFLYTDELPDDDSNFLHIFAAAGKLKIEELKNYAAKKIYDRIDTKNMLDALNLANKYDDNLMRQKSFDEIIRNYPKIEFKDDWINDAEKVDKMIKFFKEMEEKEEMFKKLME